MNKETKERVSFSVKLIVALIVIRILVVNFISLFDHLERHGIKGPADRKEIALAKEKQKK